MCLWDDTGQGVHRRGAIVVAVALSVGGWATLAGLAYMLSNLF